MNLVWQHAPYKANTLVVLLALADWSDDEGMSFPKMPAIAKKSRQSERNAQICMSRLISDGIVKLSEDGGGRSPNHYSIDLQKLHPSTAIPKSIDCGAGVKKMLLGGENGDIAIRKNRQEPSDTHQATPSQSSFAGFDETDAIQRVFKHYIEVTERHPRLYTLTEPKERMGKARFRDCMTITGGDPAKAEELMMLVVDTLAESDFHNARGKYKGRPKYNEWKHAFASTDKLQEWIERSRQ